MAVGIIANIGVLKNYNVELFYDNIDVKITKNKNILNTKDYAEFLIDKSSLNAEALKKYINNYNVVINDNLISINDDTYMTIIMLSKMEFKDQSLKNKIDEINSDSYISMKEYNDLKAEFQKSKGNEVVASLLR